MMEKSYPYKVKANGVYYKPGEPVPAAHKAEKTESAVKISPDSSDEPKTRRKSTKE